MRKEYDANCVEGIRSIYDGKDAEKACMIHATSGADLSKKFASLQNRYGEACRKTAERYAFRWNLSDEQVEGDKNETIAGRR